VNRLRSAAPPRGWAPGGGAAPGLPVVRQANGVPVRLLALCPGGGPLPEDLRAEARSARCRVTHALLPAFVLAGWLDVAEAVGGVIEEVAGGRCGARTAAQRAGIPHTTVREWLRRFRRRAGGTGWRSRRLRWSWAGVASPGRGRRPVRAGRHRGGVRGGPW
jgi:hypothetical protein